MKIDPLSIGGIIIAVLALISAWLTSRSTAKASILNAKSVAEVEAYNRAVKMDRETIERQEKEIDKLRDKNKTLTERVEQLEQDYETLEDEHTKLRKRMTALEGIKTDEQQGI